MYGVGSLLNIVSKNSAYFSRKLVCKRSMLKSPATRMSDTSLDNSSNIAAKSVRKKSICSFLSLGGLYILQRVIFCLRSS